MRNLSLYGFIALFHVIASIWRRLHSLSPFRIVRVGLTLSRPAPRHVRARDKRFSFFFSLFPFGFSRGRRKREEKVCWKREWRHFFSGRGSPETRNETKFAHCTLARSLRRLFSSPLLLSRSIEYSPPHGGLWKSPPPFLHPSLFLSFSLPPLSPDLPMEARSRDKLGQPIGIKSGRIGTPRPRVLFSFTPFYTISPVPRGNARTGTG